VAPHLQPVPTPAARPRVVVVGAGFGGLSAARALCGKGAGVTIVDKQNHHLFQPLLYQVATAGLSPADIAAPIRSIVKKHKATRVLLDEVVDVDTARRLVILADGAPLPYDYLVLATGATHSYFGRDDWSAFAPALKTIDDAIRLRRDILFALEHAETLPPGPERDRQLTFVLVGGGPTGVEMAGAIAELCRHTVTSDFRTIMSAQARVVLIEAGPRLLPSFPESLSECARRSLQGLGVEVITGARVTQIGACKVSLGDVQLAGGTVIWCAGVRASPVAGWLKIAGDRIGRIAVAPDLSLPELPEIFVIGDAALVEQADGKPVPGVAPAAKQMGKHVAGVIAARIAGSAPPRPFRYKNWGNLATIGRKRAVADFGVAQMRGTLAWLFWCVAHIFFLIGFRNRLIVGANWLWHYVTFDRGARLITGLDQRTARAQRDRPTPHIATGA
jgi:NADH:ubiquinone reductase (H+-translocating)